MKLSIVKFLLVFPMFFMCFTSLHAQDPSVQGLILEKSGLARVSNASITNKRTGIVSRSNDFGLFRIPAAIGDTLSVSKTGYMDLLLTLPSYADIVLRLQPLIQLSEVTVQSQSKKQELDELREQYRKKGSYYAGKPPLLAYIFQPLTTLYELIGKTPGQARRFNTYYYRELEQTEIDRRFNVYTIGKLTDLEDSDLKNFMVIYRPDYETLSKWDEYGLINYIKRSVITFNTSGRPKGLLSLPPLPKARDLSEKSLKY